VLTEAQAYSIAKRLFKAID